MNDPPPTPDDPPFLAAPDAVRLRKAPKSDDIRCLYLVSVSSEVLLGFCSVAFA